VEKTVGYGADENVCNIIVDDPKKNVTKIHKRTQEENI